MPITSVRRKIAIPMISARWWDGNVYIPGVPRALKAAAGCSVLNIFISIIILLETMWNARIVKKIRQIFIFEIAIWLTFDAKNDRTWLSMIQSERVKLRTLQRSISLRHPAISRLLELQSGSPWLWHLRRAFLWRVDWKPPASTAHPPGSSSRASDISN